MTPPRDTWQLQATAIGRRVLVYDCVDSTNTLATALAQSADREQLAVLSREQAAGRGQHGRTWTAAPGSSVLLSLLLFPPPELRRPPVLTAWAAVSVCVAIARLTGARATIKWPNDVLLDGKKVCGILIEQGRGLVVGIGLNVQQTPADFAAAGLVATSLSQFAAEALSTEAVARVLLAVLDEHYAALVAGNTTLVEAVWQQGLGLLGETVVAECAHVTHHGRLCELSFAVIGLERPGQSMLRLRPEQVHHLSRL